MISFFNTVSIFYRNPFINPNLAIIRHIFWQLRKIFNLFPCRLRLKNFKIIIKNRDIANGCGGLINAMGYYDPNNMYFVDELFSKGVYNVFMDIGANIGIYSLIASYRSRAKVVSIEPHPFTYKLLVENISLNSLNGRIKPYQIAFSNSIAQVYFTDNPGSSVNKIVNEDTKNPNKIKISTTTGDAFCKQNLIIPDVIKIDVEGHENSVISGFTDTITNIKIILVECFNITDTLKLFMEKIDFLGPYKIDYKNRLLSSDFTNYEDWVFVNRKAVADLESISFTIKNKP